MRSSWILASLTCALLLPGAVQAQQPPRLHIAGVRVGFPGAFLEEEGVRPHLFKANSWTPVYVDIQAGQAGLTGTEGRIEVIVETPDPDDVQTTYTVAVPLPELPPNGQFTVSTYTKVANNTTVDVKVTLRYGDHILAQTPAQASQYSGVDANQVVYLAIGSRLPFLRYTLQQDEGRATNNLEVKQHLVFAENIPQLPLHWFGYDGIDLVVLTTSKRDFLNQLLNDTEKRRRQALVEWVQRGGHLVICVGRNHDAVAAIPELQAILPMKIVKSEPAIDLRMTWRDQGGIRPLRFADGASISLAVLEPRTGQDYRTLLTEFPKKRELIVQGSAGMGLVTLVAFDIDQRPFTDWKRDDQAAFWRKLVEESWPRNAVMRTSNNNNNQNFRTFYDDASQPQLLGQLYNYLENFEEVPVISFYWVALFIFIYILVVGPLDYFFLKKVVKRLELTWITFPTVVLTVSAVAYFTAYHIKGNDLRIRKADLVDVDMTTPKPFMVGTTWFTLFSPRIQHYTVGIEPSPGDWTAPPREGTDGKSSGVVVSWLGRPDADRYGQRSRGQSFFRRAYEYEPAASGLHGVPIQVWSTKSFTATWQAAANPDRPLLAAQLRSTEGNTIAGQITWLPGNAAVGQEFELKDAYLIYNNRVQKLKLLPGSVQRVDLKEEGLARSEISSWLQEKNTQNNQNNPNTNPNIYQRNQQRRFDLDQTMRSALFFQEYGKTNLTDRNSCLRLLDQSNRLARSSEAILVGRLEGQQGVADDINKSMASPSRLWLGSLPGSAEGYKKLEGILRQDTYVRIFLPVQK